MSVEGGPQTMTIPMQIEGTMSVDSVD
jgi:hypothetical protein